MQVDPRSSPAYYLKAALILTTLAAAYYGTFFLFQSFAVRCGGAATWHRFVFSAPLLPMIYLPSPRAHAPKVEKCPCVSTSAVYWVRNGRRRLRALWCWAWHWRRWACA